MGIKQYVVLEQQGQLAEAAVAAVNEGLTVDSALIVGAYIDGVVAGCEKQTEGFNRLVGALDFYVESLFVTGNLTALNHLAKESVWATQDAMDRAMVNSHTAIAC